MRLNDTFLSTAFYEFGVSPLPFQQSDGPKNDALSCSRLTSDDGESLVELHVKTLNECEIAYV